MKVPGSRDLEDRALRPAAGYIKIIIKVCFKSCNLKKKTIKIFYVDNLINRSGDAGSIEVARQRWTIIHCAGMSLQAATVTAIIIAVVELSNSGSQNFGHAAIP